MQVCLDTEEEQYQEGDLVHQHLFHHICGQQRLLETRLGDQPA